jgi:hypothetical protein
MKRLVVALAMLTIGAGVACAPSSDKGATAGAATSPAAQQTLPPAEGVEEGSPPSSAGAEPGTSADDPLDVGKVGIVGKWEVSVAGYSANATTAVLHENMFNSKPKAGMQIALVTVKAKYDGNGQGDAFWDLSWQLIGKDGTAFKEYDDVLPNDLSDVGGVPPGVAASGNIAFEIPDSHAASSVYLFENGWGNNDGVFLALP